MRHITWECLGVGVTGVGTLGETQTGRCDFIEIFQFLSKSMQSHVFIFESRHINKQASEIKRGEKDLGPTQDPRF